MKIKKFMDFLLESTTPLQTDPPEIASEINTFNKKGDMIKDFESKKMDLTNIYMTYKDEADLINRLFSKKFINKKTNNKKEIVFNNELLSIWAQSCEKRRRLNSIEKKLKSLEEENTNIQGRIKEDPQSSEFEQMSIDKNTETINDLRKKIDDLKREIMDDEREAKTKIEKLKKELSITKQKIEKINLDKKSQTINNT